MKKRLPFKTAFLFLLLVSAWLLSPLLGTQVQAAFLTSSGKPGSFDSEDLLSLILKETPLDPSFAESSLEGGVPPYAFEDLEQGIVPSHPHATDEESPPADREPMVDVPIVFNETVENYIEYFKEEIPDRFTVWLERSGLFLPMMRETFRKHGLPEDLAYISLIESGFNPRAHSRAHAVGPWQFMKGTGRQYQLKVNRWIDERRDPVKSTDAAARHLKDLFEKFGTWPLAMAAYNAGPRKIERGLRRGKIDNYWELRKTRYIRRETRGYVPKYMAALLISKNPQRYGFYPEYLEPIAYDTIEVPALASLPVMAKAAGISFKHLKSLNPELRTEVTPPSPARYRLRLPIGATDSFKTAYAKIPESKKIFKTRYVVKRNNTLSGIAKRYGTTATQLARMNNRSTRKILRVGEVLYIPKVIPRSSVRNPRRSQTVAMADATSSGSHKVIYRVQTGDTLWDIARSFNMSLTRLKQHNGLGRRSLIRPGDILILGYK